MSLRSGDLKLTIKASSDALPLGSDSFAPEKQGQSVSESGPKCFQGLPELGVSGAGQ